MASSSYQEVPEDERPILGDTTNRPGRASLQPSHRHTNTMPSSLAASSCPSVPYVEPNPNPNIPSHFSGSVVRTCEDLNDPDFLVYQKIEASIDEILDAVEPYFISCFSKYSTIGAYYDEEGFDVSKTPKFISIELDADSIQRWAEVETGVRKLIAHAYQAHNRPIPPIRFCCGGFTPATNPQQGSIANEYL